MEGSSKRYSGAVFVCGHLQTSRHPRMIVGYNVWPPLIRWASLIRFFANSSRGPTKMAGLINAFFGLYYFCGFVFRFQTWSSFKQPRPKSSPPTRKPWPSNPTLALKAKTTLTLRLLLLLWAFKGKVWVWGLRFGLSLWGSMSLRVSLNPNCHLSLSTSQPPFTKPEP